MALSVFEPFRVVVDIDATGWISWRQAIALGELLESLGLAVALRHGTMPAIEVVPSQRRPHPEHVVSVTICPRRGQNVMADLLAVADRLPEPFYLNVQGAPSPGWRRPQATA